jgi:hypothetical protein
VIEGLSDINGNNRLALVPKPATDRGRTIPQPAPAGSSSGPVAVPLAPVPAHPPAEVLEMLDTAAQVLQDLAAAQVSLHIEVVDGGAGKRIHVQVLDADGELLREIPPHQLLDVLAGTSLGVTFDEKG